METRLQELQKFEAEITAAVNTNQESLQAIRDALKVNQDDVLRLQLDAKETSVTLGRMDKKMEEINSKLGLLLTSNMREVHGSPTADLPPQSAVTGSQPKNTDSLLGSGPNSPFQVRNPPNSPFTAHTQGFPASVGNISFMAGHQTSVSAFAGSHSASPSNFASMSSHSSVFNHHTPAQQHMQNVNAPRNPRIEYPIYDGESSVKGWIFQCEQYFMMNGVADEARTQTASAYVRGKALQWMEFYMRGKRGFPPWPDFCRDICLRFDLTYYERPVIEWKKVFQKGTVMEYQEEFELAKARVDCEELFAVDMFIGGLKEEIQNVLINLNPQTLSQAFQAARVQEAQFNLIMRRTRPQAALPW